MLMNSMNDVCADISRDGNKSRIFIDEVLKIHKRLMTEDGDLHNTAINSTTLKDPPVIRKGTENVNEENEKEKNPVVQSDKAVTGSSVNIWMNEDGSISAPTEEIPGRGKKSKKQNKPKFAVKSIKSSQKEQLKDGDQNLKDRLFPAPSQCARVTD